MSWADAVLIGRIVGANDENSNRGGLVIEVRQNPNTKSEEVGRVAFDRAEGADPDSDFNAKADEVVATARKSIEMIKELFASAGRLQ